MKAVMLSTLIVCGLDLAFDGAAGIAACWTLTTRLVHGTERDIGSSVYRR